LAGWTWSAAEGVSPARPYIRLIVNIVASLPFIVAGAFMMSGLGSGLHWLAAGVIIALVTAVWNAWMLLIEILR
jgi:hypothetical protein